MIDSKTAEASASAVPATERALARIASRERSVRAWAQVDEAGAREQAVAIDADEAFLPLRGLTLGVKDIIDVRGLQCECGSPIFRGKVAFGDAPLVAKLRALGMVVIGKTETAEYAYLQLPATRNPANLDFSPGGSSSGSAAAVADGHVDAALGTQTAGSILRPASFCGVVGYKPTYGRISRVGVLSASPAVDTIGWISRDVGTSIRMRRALAGPSDAAAGRSLGFMRTVHWAKAEPAMRAGVERLAASLSAMEVVSLSAVLDDVHGTIMRYEMREELATQRLQAPALLSAALAAYLDGAPIPLADYVAALAFRDRFDAEAMFAGVDVLMTPAACGEAVAFGSSGDPCFNRFVTLLGLPSVTLPFGFGVKGLPLGLQLFARKDQDDMLLATAATIERWLSEQREVAV